MIEQFSAASHLPNKVLFISYKDITRKYANSYFCITSSQFGRKELKRNSFSFYQSFPLLILGDQYHNKRHTSLLATKIISKGKEEKKGENTIPALFTKSKIDHIF